MERFFLILIFSCIPCLAQANSCCGQTPASFPVLALDQKISVNTSYSVSTAEGRIYNPDQFVVWNSKDRQVQSLQLSVAGTLRSRHQFYANTAFVKSQFQDFHQNDHAQSMSDTQAGYSYEVLPEFSYSRWRPVIYTSLLLNLPTGKSIYDNTQLSEGTDVTGHNQWGLGVGFTMRKVYFPVTLLLQGRALQILKRQFSNVEVSSFYDSSLAMLGSYSLNWQALTLHLGVTTNHLSSRTLNSSIESQSMQNTSLLVGLQKSMNETWTVGLNYSDQTLLGPAKNSVLNKTFTMNLNYNYF
jgi:hypothetical protein